MTTLQAALLGVVQGLTEFLPISSSAHLILARAFFEWDAGDTGLAFDIACHVGTLLAVLVFFRAEVFAMVLATPRAWRGARDDDDDSVRLLRSVVIGTLPIVVVGLFMSDVIGVFRRPEVVGVTLALGGVVMLMAERSGSRTRMESTLGPWESLGLGVAQATALVPGVSRSGAVLTVAMLLGVRRERAARYAFLLGIPAIVAAAAKAVLDLSGQGLPAGVAGLFVVGLSVSAVVGYLTVKYFIQYLSRYTLNGFAVYRFALAAVVLVWILAV